MRRQHGFGALIAGLVILSSLGAAAASPDVAGDAYLQGYAAAILEEKFGVTPRTLSVRDGILTIGVSDLRRAADYAATIQAVAANDFSLRPLPGYSLTVAK